MFEIINLSTCFKPFKSDGNSPLNLAKLINLNVLNSDILLKIAGILPVTLGIFDKSKYCKFKSCRNDSGIVPEIRFKLEITKYVNLVIAVSELMEGICPLIKSKCSKCNC